ncbi:acyltransferase [Flavobacterium ustbae]|uniref:acyltransferase n=1 Tax=Flavobacterium ustbae TaxID=2488790 RepID=UPI000F79655F|nr:acyltransferase [Flavobacterium ustbae]
MKRLIRVFVEKILFFFHYVFSPNLFKGLNRTYNVLYSIWIRNEFKKSGKGFFVSSPLYLEGGEFISVGMNFGCDQRLRLDALDSFLGEKFTPCIEIGNNVSIQKDCHIGAINKIVIGDNVLIASKVYITDHSHGEITEKSLILAPAQRKLYSKGSVIIEDNVWLGEGVVVLPNVTIGENCIIGANAVVTKSIPKNCVAAGNPARVIREIK